MPECVDVRTVEALLREQREEIERLRREREAWVRIAGAAEDRRELAERNLAQAEREGAEWKRLWERTLRASRSLHGRWSDARCDAAQAMLVVQYQGTQLETERATVLDLRASLVEAVTLARGTVGECTCLTCAPAQRLAERWERQVRGER